VDVEVLDFDLAASVAECAGKDFGEPACTVPASCTTDRNATGTGGQVGVVGEVGDEFAGAGGVQDDVLDAGIEAVQIEDVAGGGRVTEPVADVLDPVGGGRDGEAVRTDGEVQIAERDQADRAHEGASRYVVKTGTTERRARPGRSGAALWVVLLGGGVGDHEELVAAEVHHDLGVGAPEALGGGVLFRRP
jgi:hypothetical protein